MALPMLISGSECGPSNPLRGLSKRFDHDRGLQQDHFGASRAGSSRETFRTQPISSGHDRDAAQFFSSNSPPVSQLAAATAYDFSALHEVLPPSHMQPSAQSPQLQQQNLITGWSYDFMQQKPMHTLLSPSTDAKVDIQAQQDATTVNAGQIGTIGVPLGGVQRNSFFAGNRISPMTGFAPPIPTQSQKPTIRADQSLWDKEFHSQEISLSSSLVPLQEIQQNQQNQRLTSEDADDLAHTAGRLLEIVKDEPNPKFQNSQFMGLMKQLRDRIVVVEGNEMVENDKSASSAVAWATDFQADTKGKGKALNANASHAGQVDLGAGYRALRQNDDPPLMRNQDLQDSILQQEDANDRYFRQENEDYTRWNDLHAEALQSVTINQTDPWDQLQSDWDQFEATSAGIKVIDNYQFQANNPYLLGASPRTRHHALHLNDNQSPYESVLELEAAVQRNIADAGAWFELGVKQQENEREQKAIQALRRAIDLDPLHLPTWLALAISYTNDGNRLGTYSAIREWVDRNGKYQAAVHQYRAQTPESPNASIVERFSHLIQCLIAMARANTGGEVDADIQVALAVLLNTNEDYGKAQDCFRTALAVRPEDWLLYNRVGATMANNGHAEEALQYYYQALSLNPGYIRARFNLGISCINLRRYGEAAQHILDALSLQDADCVRDSDGVNDKRGVTSAALWDSLKTTCLHMQRVDLASLCDSRDLGGLRGSFQN